VSLAWSASPAKCLMAAAGRVEFAGKRLGQLILLCLLCSLISACKVQLYSGLTQRDANEMLAVLLQAGIEAETAMGKEDVSLKVEQSQIERAINLLNQRGLPHRKFQTLGDVFKQESLISSPLEQRARMIYAMSEELSRTLLQFDGVIVARVHIALPDRKPNETTPTPPSAAVYIKYQDGYDISAYVPQIKQLVANSIEGLTFDKVTVVPIRATPSVDLNIRPKAREYLDQQTLLMLVSGVAVLIIAGAAAAYLVIQRRRDKAAVKAG
jgi:type III secretion protein J